MRITTGAKIVFFVNLIVLFLMIVISISMLDSQFAIFLCEFSKNLLGREWRGSPPAKSLTGQRMIMLPLNVDKLYWKNILLVKG